MLKQLLRQGQQSKLPKLPVTKDEMASWLREPASLLFFAVLMHNMNAHQEVLYSGQTLRSDDSAVVDTTTCVTAIKALDEILDMRYEDLEEMFCNGEREDTS
jgi:hypothetical protein